MGIDRRTFMGSVAGGMAALGVAGRAKAQTAGPARPFRLATEEAFATPEMIEGWRGIAAGVSASADLAQWRTFLDGGFPSRTSILGKLLDIGDGRIADMDAHGVDMQLLSLTSPGVQVFNADQAVAIARDANDRLAEAVARHPTRFAGLVAIAPQAPEEAAREIERGMTRLGLNGVIVNSHTRGEYLDEEKFWPILEAAEAHDAPIYIHPRAFEDADTGPYAPYELSGARWGFAAETGLHGMRLLMSGVLERFPRLKIVLGHAGEGIPYWLYRIDYTWEAFTRSGVEQSALTMKPSDYFRRNFRITTSGMNDPQVLDFCIERLGPENVLWAIDYPFQRAADAVAFMDSAPVDDEVRRKVYATNAAELFGIDIAERTT